MMVRIETHKDGGVKLLVDGKPVALAPPGQSLVLTPETSYGFRLEHTK